MGFQTTDVGCLMLADGGFARALSGRLNERGARVVRADGETLDAARDGLFRISGCGRICAAAEGTDWARALALAAQLRVDRIVLLRPEPSERRSPAEAFARRNLCFCVSDILIFDGADGSSLREMDALCRGLCSARIWRLPGGDAETAARFLLADEPRSALLSENETVFSAR